MVGAFEAEAYETIIQARFGNRDLCNMLQEGSCVIIARQYKRKMCSCFEIL